MHVPASHKHVRALPVSKARRLLNSSGANVIHTAHMKRPFPPRATLLYNNHHAACLFPFRQGSAVLIDPLDGGSTSFVGGGGGSGVASLTRLAKAKVRHGFPGRGGDRRLYRFPLKATPLQSLHSECCMWISIGLVRLFCWGARHGVVTVGRVQRLVSFLRQRGRVSDSLIRHAARQVQIASHLR